ncbi:hypothetical protein [Caballeronia sp. INML2]|jgi:hypothetical protein|uniref:hypothetical protein n=1 Tax=Caballeronia sp. INML2 TaxID=2921748 RepID=UPI00202991D4|nr:hypothetical protein [Caballeronia sp. INML2]
MSDTKASSDIMNMNVMPDGFEANALLQDAVGNAIAGKRASRHRYCARLVSRPRLYRS